MNLMTKSRLEAHRDHRREWKNFDYAYPVLSRRSKGISVGINLNPDKVCNFDCVYCEVNRKTPGKRSDISLTQITQEVEELLDLVENGLLYEANPFRDIPSHLRRLNDIAFSGDGEPTTCQEFPLVVQEITNLLKSRNDSKTKLILITDSSNLLAPHVINALEIMMANRGEIWLKLDAGTNEYYKEINRTHVPFEKILHNIERTSQRYPVTIQSLFLRWNGLIPTREEIDSFANHLQRFIRNGSQLQALQIYTVARPTPELNATALTLKELKLIEKWVLQRVPSLPIEIYEGNA